jgi:hypothetical protein
MGVPGDRLYKFDNGGQIWAKPLTNKDFAVIFYNFNFFGSVEMVLNWSDLGFSSAAALKVRDLWLQKVSSICFLPRIIQCLTMCI